MSRRTEEKQGDIAKWYYEHRPIVQQYDLIKRVEFLEIVIHNLLLFQTYLVEDIQEVEGRKHLWIPNGMQMSGDMKRFG